MEERKDIVKRSIRKRGYSVREWRGTKRDGNIIVSDGNKEWTLEVAKEPKEFETDVLAFVRRMRIQPHLFGKEGAPYNFFFTIYVTQDGKVSKHLKEVFK